MPDLTDRLVTPSIGLGGPWGGSWPTLGLQPYAYSVGAASTVLAH